MLANVCPPRNRLKDYLSGKLDPENSEVLAQHLSDCRICEETATSIEEDPETLIELLSDESHKRGEDCELKQANAEVSHNGARYAWQPSASAVEFPATMPRQIGSYELLQRLGSGGMGAVYLARHKNLDKQFALKLLPALPAQNTEFVARFRREIRAAGKLDHPAIVRSTDAGEDAGVHFLVMDAIDGLDLSRIARAEEKLTVADACEILRQAALGLAHAHEQGIVHRDVKPSNLMLDVEGQVRILDFGLAQVGMWESGSAEITTVGQLMGTLDYMAPEQAERGGAVDYRADLYSLGATLFRFLTGRAPLAAAPNLTPLEKLRLLATHKAPKLRSLRQGVPKELSQIVDALLSRDPSARPASASHVAELLEPFAEGADLAALLNRSRAKEDERKDRYDAPDDSWAPLRNAPLSLMGSGSSPQVATKTSRTSNSSWLTWLSLAVTAALIFGGIVFVLETSKGQLVIDSETELTVKLIEVDASGDETDQDELRILPGTNTTRLRSGKYEIALASPSDSFAISKNQSFEIRRGETIVATITPKPTTKFAEDRATKSAEDTAIARDAAKTGPVNRLDAEGNVVVDFTQPDPSDPRLTRIVYNGETLQTWVNRLQYERNPEKVQETLEAIAALASEDLRDIVEEPLIEFALRQKRSTFAPNTLTALAASAGDDLPSVAVRVLRQADAIEFQRSFFSHASSAILARRFKESGQVAPALDFVAETLREQKDAYILGQAKSFTRSLMSAPTASEKTQDAMLYRLKAIDRLTNERFWFSKLADADYYKPFQAEIIRRAVEAIADASNTDEQTTRALLILASTHAHEPELSPSQREKLQSAFEGYFEQIAKNPELAGAEILVDNASLEFAIPIGVGETISKGPSRSSRSSPANRLIVTLNVVNHFALQSSLGESLSALHQVLRAQPIAGDKPTKTTRADWHFILQQRNATPSGSARYNLVVEQLQYLQTGYLLGKQEAELVARFDQMLPADIERNIASALDDIEYETPGQRRNATQILEAYLPPNHERAAKVLQNDFIKNPSTKSSDYSLWARAAGPQFLDSYAEALANAHPDYRQRLLQLDFYELREFQCSEPKQLEQLLAWCDSVMLPTDQADAASGANEAGPQLSPSLAAELKRLVPIVLSSLLVDRSEILTQASGNRAETGPVSEACQLEIVEHLATYALSDASLWLSRPVRFQRYFGSVGSPEFRTWDKPMREAVVHRAIERLVSRPANADEEKLKCQALMVLSSAAQEGHEFEPVQLVKVQSALTEILRIASEHPSKVTNLHDTELRFYQWYAPKFGDAKLLNPSTQNDSREDTSNLTILALNLIQDLNLASKLTDPVTALHQATLDLEIMAQSTVLYYFTQRSVNSWEQELQNRFNSRRFEREKLIQQTWLLQTGAILGKDIQELRERPRKLYEADREYKRRFIQEGDTLAIHIPGVLPQSGDPPVIQAGKSAPVVGFPVPVAKDGTIQLPLIDPLAAKDLELNALVEAITNAYTKDRQVLRSDTPLGITVQFLLRAGSPQELRNISGAVIPKEDR